MQTKKVPLHHHEEYPEHDWKRDITGKIDEFGAESGYHNGPFCLRCFYSFCIHCDPDGWDKVPCVVDWDECPNCGYHVQDWHNYCPKCGQALSWEETNG